MIPMTKGRSAHHDRLRRLGFPLVLHQNLPGKQAGIRGVVHKLPAAGSKMRPFEDGKIPYERDAAGITAKSPQGAPEPPDSAAFPAASPSC